MEKTEYTPEISDISGVWSGNAFMPRDKTSGVFPIKYYHFEFKNLLIYTCYSWRLFKPMCESDLK